MEWELVYCSRVMIPYIYGDLAEHLFLFINHKGELVVSTTPFGVRSVGVNNSLNFFPFSPALFLVINS